MNQSQVCTNCANKKDNGCKYCDVCITRYDAESGTHTSTHWKPIGDNVNHPSHYETGKYECFDVMVEAIGEEEAKGFCLCNAFKYIYRCKIKNETPTEDIKKAI